MTTPPSRGDDLLAAILADPDDDEPRLVYADWLVERGDPRGEFIHVQCALARDHQKRGALIARERALLAAHGAEWLAPLHQWTTKGIFRRGFVDEVRIGAPHFPRLAERIVHTLPLQSLVVHGLESRDVALHFTGVSQLRQLRRLQITARIPLAHGAVRVLAEAPTLRSLERLSLAGCAIGDGGLARLVSGRFRHLSALDLAANGLEPMGIAMLADSEAFPALRELALADPFGPRGIAALVESPLGHQLARLTLHAAAGHQGLRSISEAAAMTLRYLDLADNDLDDRDAAVLAATDHHTLLEVLDLQANRIADTKAFDTRPRDKLPALREVIL